jgi:Glycosyl transferase family 2
MMFIAGSAEKPKAPRSETSSVSGGELSRRDLNFGHLQAVRVAVLVPCYNEELTIQTVVADFRAALPEAAIYVYDNNSTDQSYGRACDAGAIVRREEQKGKGNVIRRMFADVEADVYLIVDGDATYDAASARPMIQMLLEGNLDLINGARVTDIKEAFRHGHRFGNEVLTRVVAAIFGARISDMLSGYKVLSRRFVKSFPALSAGFEIETELAVHALQLRMPLAELATRYGPRAEGATSKLRTVRDGLRIIWAIFVLIKEERPLAFFSVTSAALVALSLALTAPVAITFLETGLVPRLPTAVLGMGIMLLAFLSLTCGLVLDTVTRSRIEMKRLHYLSLAAPCTVFDK